MLSGILQSAISGLRLNSQRVAASADNVANVTTIGYKSVTVNGSTLVTPNATGAYAPGGVLSMPRRAADVQGLLAASASPTDMAVAGSGFFAVRRSASGGEVLYSRDGSFAPDAAGNLVNASGLHLLARAPGGGETLRTVNVHQIGGTAQATTAVSVRANLPSTAQVGETFTISARATDSLGNGVDIPLTFEAQAGGGYRVTVGTVTESASGATTAIARSGSSAGPAYEAMVAFGADGLPASVTAPTLNVSDLSGGAAELNIQLDFGQAGRANGLTRFGSEFVLGGVSADGAAYGDVQGVSVDADGTLTATFDNGETRTVANIPVATFASPQGLEAVGGNAWRETQASGAATLRDPGTGGAGQVQGGALELSTTDLGSEFANMIVSETAYRASLQVLAAGDELARSLLDVRA